MPILDVEPGRLYSLNEVADLLPCSRVGKKVAHKTLYRWRESGRLKCVKRPAGGRHYWFVSGAELLRLFEMPPEPQTRPRTGAEARAGHNRAAKLLREKYGLAAKDI